MARRPILFALAAAAAACGGSGSSADAPPGDSGSADAAPLDAPPTGVVYDNATSGSALCTASPCTLTHTVGAGDHALVLVWFFCANGGSGSTAVTVDGSDAIFAAASDLTKDRGELWYAPAASGDRAILVATQCTQAHVSAMSVTNADTAAPIRSTVRDGSDGGSMTIMDTVTSMPGDLVVDGVCHGDTLTGPDAPATSRYLDNITGSFACGSYAGSTQPGAAPSVTSNWTSTISDHWIYLAVSLKPTPAP
jgi:hypothetical protein